MNQDTYIYLYDSGFGTLALAEKLLRMSYRVTLFADLKNAPYGNKPPELVKEFAKNNIEYLHGLTPPDAKSVVVVCCNTADICGLEPLKNEGIFRDTENRITMGVVNPAIGALVADKDCELAFLHMTQNSFNSGRFMAIEQHRPDMLVIPTAFDGLAPAIDKRDFKEASMLVFSNIAKKHPKIKKEIQNRKGKPRVGLFCTHFALVKDWFEMAHHLVLEHAVQFVDQAGLVAEMVSHEVGSPAAAANHLGRLLTTGDAVATTVHFKNHRPLKDYWDTFENGHNFEHVVVGGSDLEKLLISPIASKAVGPVIPIGPESPKGKPEPKFKITPEGLEPLQ